MNHLFYALALCALMGCSTPTTPLAIVCNELIVRGSLNYPLNGSVNVMDSENVVVVSLGAYTLITLTATSGSVLTSTQIVPIPNPLPQPNNPLSPGVAFRIPMLSAATTYSVMAGYTQIQPCQNGGPVGSLTTR